MCEVAQAGSSFFWSFVFARPNNEGRNQAAGEKSKGLEGVRVPQSRESRDGGRAWFAAGRNWGWLTGGTFQC